MAGLLRDEIGENLISPKIVFDTPYLYMLIGVIGTTIAPWQLFLHAESGSWRAGRK